MQFSMYSVFDKTALQYGRPFCSQSRAVATRSFSSEVNNPDSGMLYQHPLDFDLYEVAVFDDETGVITPHERPNFVIAGSFVLQQRLDREAAAEFLKPVSEDSDNV